MPGAGSKLALFLNYDIYDRHEFSITLGVGARISIYLS